MRKATVVTALVVAAALLVAGNGYAQSAKATAMVSNVTLLDWTTDSGGWQTLLTNTIKTANQKDLFIDVSLECGLFTKTLVRSKGGSKDTSTATATIRVRVLVDNDEAQPGRVVFDKRMQELSATLEGMIADCLSVDESGNIVLDEGCVTPEEIELIQRTLSANSFNFVAPVESGDHVIRVQARISTDTDADEGVAAARAMVGMGSVTVEEVRMIRNEDWLQLPD